MTLNEWRSEQGMTPLPWGNAWWAGGQRTPVTGLPAAPSQEPPQTNNGLGSGDAPGRQAAPTGARIAYGTPQHVQRWERLVETSTPWETKFSELARSLFDRQFSSILTAIKGRTARDFDPANPFDRARWIREFRQAVRTLLREIVTAGGQMAMDDLGPAVTLDFNLAAPAVIRFLEDRAQRFAVQVNETTWDALKSSLAEGIQAGETIDDLARRVESVMIERRSTAETIARTEVIGALNGGTLEAWRQSGVVRSKKWLAALDDRVRESHRTAHGQVVGLDENFQVGDGQGQHPGAIGIAAEDINCRCSMVAVLDVEA